MFTCSEKKMVEVEKRIRVHKDDKVVEAVALFDTGSRRSYFSKDFARKLAMSLEESLKRFH
jgi:hypothetical protein